MRTRRIKASRIFLVAAPILVLGTALITVLLIQGQSHADISDPYGEECDPTIATCTDCDDPGVDEGCANPLPSGYSIGMCEFVLGGSGCLQFSWECGDEQNCSTGEDTGAVCLTADICK